MFMNARIRRIRLFVFIVELNIPSYLGRWREAITVYFTDFQHSESEIKLNQEIEPPTNGLCDEISYLIV